MIEDLCEQFVIGHNPFQIELLWQTIYASRHDWRHPGLYMTPALSAIEIALWDIVGKATNQPVYNLLGGRVHDKLRAYAYMPTEGIWENPQKAGDIAIKLVEAGNSACKFDPFTPLFPQPRDFSLKTIRHVGKIFRAIRDAVGDELEIGIGTHGQLSTAVAIRVAKELEQYSPFWFEEPVPPENIDEMARVAAHTSIPIATGERLVTIFEFADLLKKQAAQIIQLDVGQCGGILESKKIAGMAEAFYAHDRAAHVLRASRRRRRYSARYLFAQFPNSRIQRQPAAPGNLQRADCLRKWRHHTTDRPRLGRRAG